MLKARARLFVSRLLVFLHSFYGHPGVTFLVFVPKAQVRYLLFNGCFLSHDVRYSDYVLSLFTNQNVGPMFKEFSC